jgi:RimJ/RimL family protein N-acetyltransferase
VPTRVDLEFIRRRTAEIQLRDGTRVLIRPVMAGDKERLIQGLAQLSPRSRYQRFLSVASHLPPTQLAYFTEIDYFDHYAIGAIAPGEPAQPGIGVARYVRVPGSPHVAEVAVTVVDAFHRRGLGTLLLRAVATVAVRNGIQVFQAEVLGENRAARALLGRFRARVERSGNPSLFSVELTPQLDRLQGDPYQDTLEAIARGDAGPADKTAGGERSGEP